MSGRIWPRYWTTSRLGGALDRVGAGTPRAGRPSRAGSPCGRVAPTREQQQRLLRVAALGGVRRVLSTIARSRDLGDDAGALREAEHVEDQRDPAVAHDGGAGEGRDALELLAERLDDDLLGVVDAVDDQAELPVVGLQHDDVDDVVAPRRRAGSTLPSSRFEVDERQQVAAQPVDRRAVDASRCRAPACSPSSRTSSSRLTCGMA